jgi:hypothetical protein
MLITFRAMTAHHQTAIKMRSFLYTKDLRFAGSVGASQFTVYFKHLQVDLRAGVDAVICIILSTGW